MALRIVYNENVSSFEDLLQRDQSVSIHHRKIRLLEIELYKTRNNISSDMNELFLTNFDHKQIVQEEHCCAVNNGLKRYLGPESWNMPLDIGNSRNIEEFTMKIKCWIPKICPCRLCLNYIRHVRYLDQPYFWEQTFRGTLPNRKSTYFGKGC